MPPSSTADPDVSVVIPARNEERYVGRALASVAAQTWPLERIEAIVIDNGSVDGTQETVRRFMEARPNLTVRLVAEPEVGIAPAKNRGVGSAAGTWLLFMDADSRMAPDLVERVVGRARAGCRVGSIRVIADSRDRLDRAFFGLMEFGKELFDLHAQMFYCERAVFLRLGGFRSDFRLAEDREFLQRVKQDGVHLCRITESHIATSPRRLRRLPFRLGMVTMLLRWALANWGIGRRWRY
jgi:glycosyltransferase involved in cell wall biosynthesis